MRLLSILLIVLLLSSCERAPPPVATSLPVDRVLGPQPDAGFTRATQPASLQFPADHGPHEDFALEWWYLSGNVYTPGGRRFGYQFTLFRIGLRPGAPAADSRWRSNQIYMGHAAITDVSGRRHYSAQRLSRAAAGLAGAGSQPLAIWLDSWSLRGGGEPFPLALSADAEDFGIALQLAAGEKPLILQGEQGLSRKSATPGNASYYYSFTRLPTAGTLRVGATAFTVSGESWLDHEWSSSALDDDQAGWDWFALQLDDGRERMFYRLRYRDGSMHPYSRGSLVLPDGSTRELTPALVTLTPESYWEAPDGTRYPVAWRLAVPEEGLDLRVNAVLDDQVMDDAVRYWEGAVDVTGSHTGKGYLELSGYMPPHAGE
jgi:predicted secreted hydrolase